MISKKTLRELIDQKLKDADALVARRRYATAIYIAGYALELALKLKICKILKFTQGFPENKIEFGVYQNGTKSQLLLNSAITQIKDIKSHDLNKLLFYSGVEYRIRLHYLNDWNLVVGWNPEMRYTVQKIHKSEAVNNVDALKRIIKNIIT